MPKTRSKAQQENIVPWYLSGGDEECPHCGQWYAYELEFRCPDCDSPSCPHCKCPSCVVVVTEVEVHGG